MKKHSYNYYRGIMRQIKLFTLLFASILFFGLSSVSSAQVIEGDVFLITQAEVNSFAGTSITGHLGVVQGSDIVDLTPLSTLTSVGGYLSIEGNDVLTNLDGLSSLTSVGSDLIINGNNALTNLDGLSNITSVGGHLSVFFNDALNSFCGLYTLLSSNGLGGDYNVYDNLLNPTQQQIIDDGPCITSALVENELLPKYYNLQQNYPNPFNPQTTIGFDVKEFTTVSLKLYNISGQLISTLVDKRMQPGNINFHLMRLIWRLVSIFITLKWVIINLLKR